MQAALSGCAAVRPARLAAPSRVAPFQAAPRAAAPRTAARQLQPAASAAAATEAQTSAPQPSYSGAADKYAVVEIGGHQLVVEEGRWYTVNRLEVAPGSKIQLGRVLAHKAGGQFSVGAPYMAGVAVEAEVLEELKAPKVIVYKYKAKKHYRRLNGHRQPLSKILITRIG